MDTDAPAPKSTLAAAAPRRRPRGFLIALCVLLVLLVLAALALYLLPHFLPIGTIRSIAKSKARELAGMDVDFGNLRFGWNGDVVVDDIAIAPVGPDGQPGEPLLTIREARTNIALTPLLSGKAIVNSIEINGFTAKVRREADGSLNIPDFSKISREARAAVPAAPSRRGMMLSAPAEAPEPEPAASASGGLPPVEVHRLDLNKGTLVYEDAGRNLSLDVGLDFLRVEGRTLDEPFVLSGRLIPYPADPSLGDLPFTGRVAMIRNGAFDPGGEATLDARAANLSLHEMADKFGMGELVRSARTNGEIKVHYSGGKAAVDIVDFSVSDASIGLSGGRAIAVPDSTASLNALFDPVPGTLVLSGASLANDIAAVRGQGRVEGIHDLSRGGLPSASVDFSGSLDFSRAMDYAAAQNLGLDGLPALRGRASFIGKAALPAQDAGAPISPTLAVDFNDGEIQVLANGAESPLAAMELKGLGVRAAASLGGAPEVNASVSLANVPGRAFVAKLGRDPVSFVLNGGAAMTHSPEGTVVELRFDNAGAALPATPWSSPATIRDAQARLRFDLNRDRLQIDSLRAAVDDAFQGGVVSGAITGILAGAPNGQVDIEFSSILDQLRKLAAPVVPEELVPQLAGTLRGAARLKMEGGAAEALVRGELNASHGILTPVPGSRLEFQTPKTSLSVLAGLDPARPDRVTLHSLEASLADTAVGMTDGSGSLMNGGVGAGLVKAAGVIDLAAGEGRLTAFSVDVNGMKLAMGRDGQQTASLASGLMKAVATPSASEQEMRIPLAGRGDFVVPGLDLGVDNLVFNFNDAESRFGNVRAKIAADGYIGPDKRQIVNLRTASLAASPLAVNSRGQFDLGSGAALAEYAARVAPAGLASLLGYLGLPPSLLTDAAVTGTIAFNGNQVNSKGAAQGRLQTAPNETSPFEMAHDLSAAWNPADGSLSLDVRRLDGNVKTPSGEPVASMAAQQSRLLLSRAGSKGLLDIRVNGSAGPSRQLILGLAGILPQLGGLANTLNQARADGVYNAWLQVKDLDPATLSINIGGEWQGAALRIGDTPYLAEAAKLSANLVGELAYQTNQLRLSRLFLRSDSGMMQADGTASVSYTADANHMPTGFSHLDVDARFVMADLSRAALVFPGVMPGDLGLAGRMDGTLRAGGDANNIDITQAAVNFQQFAAKPSGDMEISIPNGGVTLGGSVSLHMNGKSTGSPYDALTLFDLRNGTAAVRGLSIRGKAVNEMSSAFSLANGVLTIDSARITVGDGSEGGVQAQGRVDFSSAQPAVSMRLALRNIPLAEVNSEIADYMQIKSGNINLPAQTGQAFGVSFAGLDEDSILRTLSLENFNFATGRVVMETGPALNAELDRARVIMKQNRSGNESRILTFSRIEGTANARGDGVIEFPESAPINLIGEDTGDFRAQGTVHADHTMNIRAMVAGKIENLIGFTLPNIIPNLLVGGGNDTGNRLMDSLNASAAQGKYGVNVTGPLEGPDISGIGALAGQFLQDILKSQLLGGVTNLAKDAPQAILNLGSQVVDGLVHPGDTLKHAPENILKAPENLVKNLGGMFGLRQGGQNEQQGEGQEAEQQQHQQQPNPRDAVKNLGRMFGIGSK